jgi:hypothetical protein
MDFIKKKQIEMKLKSEKRKLKNSKKIERIR